MIPVPPLLEELARLVLEAVLNGLWQGLLLTALVAAGLRLLRGTRPSTRYAVWLATLLVVVGLPLAALVRSAGTPIAGPVAATSLTAAGAGAGPGAGPVPEAEHRAGALASEEEGAWRIEVPAGGWVLALAGLGLLVAAARVARVASALGSLRRLKRTSRPLPPAYRAPLERVRDEHLRRTVELRVSERVAAPLTLGFFQPVILFPERLLEELKQEELLQVALHELAHVRRGDAWTKLAQRLLEAVFFFHPAVHWIGRRLELERELACDDYVVAHSAGERAYARCLTRLAELTVAARYARLAPGAAPSAGQLTHRVHALLAPERAACGRASVAACSVVAVGITAAGATLLHAGPEIGILVQERPAVVAAASLPSAAAGGTLAGDRPEAESRAPHDSAPVQPATRAAAAVTKPILAAPTPAAVRPSLAADPVLVAATASARRVEPGTQRSVSTLPAGAGDGGAETSPACGQPGEAGVCGAAGTQDSPAPQPVLADAEPGSERDGEATGSGASAVRPAAAGGGGRAIDIGVSVALPLLPRAGAARGGMRPSLTRMPPQPAAQPAPVMNMFEAIRGGQVQIGGSIRLRIGGGSSWSSPAPARPSW